MLRRALSHGVSDDQARRAFGAIREPRRAFRVCAHQAHLQHHARYAGGSRIFAAAGTRIRVVTTRIALVRAPNPSAMTLSGTNSYLIDCGNGRAVCIDPGPAIDSHVRALVQRAADLHCKIALIALTHTHPDHAPAAPLLAERTGAPIGAHAKTEFPHTRGLHDGDMLDVGRAQITVMEAPGHTFDHLVFYDRDDAALLTGDTVLGEGYVVIAPPNGAMRAYQRTLHRLLEEFPDARTIYGGH